MNEPQDPSVPSKPPGKTRGLFGRLLKKDPDEDFPGMMEEQVAAPRTASGDRPAAVRRRPAFSVSSSARNKGLDVLRGDKTRILVTGGAGFIGSVLVGTLNTFKQRRIVVVDALGSDEKWRNLAPLRFEDYIEAGTFASRLRSDPQAFGTFSAVFHLGACSSTTERDMAYLVANNFEYTKLLAEWALRQEARFIYASSAATYGDGTAGMDDRSANLAAFRPLNAYGYSKQMFDQHAQAAGYLQDIVGLKYFNIFGPNEEHKGDMRSVVSKAWRQIVDTGSVRLFKSYHPEYPDGGQQRDFLYVKDAVAMTLHLAESPRAHGLYNIGSGEARTWLELVTPIFQALGREPRIEFIEMPENIRAHYQYRTQADIGKLRESGYNRTVTPLDEAVIDYVTNYLVPGTRFGDGPEAELMTVGSRSKPSAKAAPAA